MGFEDDIRAFRKKVERKSGDGARMIALEALARILKRSPVDTGRFRANNQVSLNDLPSESTIEVDKTGSATIRHGSEVLAMFKPGDTIFIYNNLVYAVPIEYGHSGQAPQGVYRVTIEELKAKYGMR